MHTRHTIKGLIVFLNNVYDIHIHIYTHKHGKDLVRTVCIWTSTLTMNFAAKNHSVPNPNPLYAYQIKSMPLQPPPPTPPKKNNTEIKSSITIRIVICLSFLVQTGSCCFHLTVRQHPNSNGFLSYGIRAISTPVQRPGAGDGEIWLFLGLVGNSLVQITR